MLREVLAEYTVNPAAAVTNWDKICSTIDQESRKLVYYDCCGTTDSLGNRQIITRSPGLGIVQSSTYFYFHFHDLQDLWKDNNIPAAYGANGCFTGTWANPSTWFRPFFPNGVSIYKTSCLVLIHCDLQPSPVLHVSGAFHGAFSIAGALSSVGKDNECPVLLLYMATWLCHQPLSNFVMFL